MGHTEIEIFSAKDWWTRPGDEVLKTCIARYNDTFAAQAGKACAATIKVRRQRQSG
jgi:hypothetical protein